MIRIILPLILLAVLACSKTSETSRTGKRAVTGSDTVPASVDAVSEDRSSPETGDAGRSATETTTDVRTQAERKTPNVNSQPDVNAASDSSTDQVANKGGAEPFLPPDEPSRKEYIDGKWVYYNFSEAWGLPVGLSPVPDNAKVIRDHYEFIIEKKQVKTLTKYSSTGKIIWSREYRYRPEVEMSVDGYTEKSGQGKVMAVVKFNQAADTARVINPGGGPAGRQCYELKRTLDPRGRVVKEACFDRGGRPSVDIRGVAVKAFELDSNGLVLAESNLSAQGLPVKDTDSVHRVEYQRGPDGDPTRTSFFGTDKKPVRHGLYFAGSIAFDYSHKGLLISEKYFDQQNLPTLANGGFHGVMYDYDNRGLLVRKTFLGLDGKLKAPDKALAAIIDMSYDDRGRLVKINYSDAENRPTFRAKGIHAERIDYPSEKEEWHTCFGADLVPRQCENGSIMTRVEYDGNGAVSNISFWSGNNKPGRRGHVFQTHKVVYERDEQGAVTAERWFNTSLVPDSVLGTAAGRQLRYGQFGEVEEETFVDAAGKPADTRWGYATLRRQHDSRGRVVSVCLYKADGSPALSSRSGLPSQGFHCMVWGYSESHFPEAVVFKGADGAELAVPVADTGLSSAAYRMVWGEDRSLLSVAVADTSAGSAPEVADCTRHRCPDMTPSVWVVNP